MESMCLAPVTPVRPAAAYVGGKRNLAKRLVTRLIALIDTIPHTTYAEPFVGMGGVFLRRQRKPRAEVINDLSREVSNFFRVLQVHYVAFLGHAAASRSRPGQSSSAYRPWIRRR